MLLRVPLSSFVTKRSVLKSVVKQAPGVSLHGLLALHLCLEKAREEPVTAQWRSVFPSLEDLSSMPLLWDPALHSHLPLPARDLLAKQCTKLDADWAAVSHLDLSRDDYTHHWLLVNTRSFYHSPSRLTPADNLALIPVADLLNHASSGCPASFTSHGLAVTADKAYPPGCEIYTTYGRHGNDLLMTEYGFLLDSNEWDEVSLDEFLLARLDDDVKAELRRLGFLGRWVLDRRTPGCFRTQVALRGLVGSSMALCIHGTEREAIQPAINKVFDRHLGEYLEEIEGKVRAVEGLGLGLGGEVLAKRWRQIAELVEGARRQLRDE